MKRCRTYITTHAVAPPALWCTWLLVAVILLTACDASIHQYPGYSASDDSPPDFTIPSDHSPLVRLVVLPVDTSGPYTMYKRVAWDGLATTTTDLVPSPSTAITVPAGDGWHRQIWLSIAAGAFRADTTLAYGEAIEAEIPQSDCKAVAFTALHPKDYADRWLWNTADMSAIELNTNLLPQNPTTAEALAGQAGLPASELSYLSDISDPPDTLIIPLSKMQGRIIFRPASTDIARFRKRYPATPRLAARIAFSQYVNIGLNAHTGSANFVVSGYEWQGYTEGDGYELLHYVLCPAGREANVRASITYFTPDGESLGRIDGIPIPLRQGRDTEVTGRLLTSRYIEDPAGLGIDDDFTDEYTVHF